MVGAETRIRLAQRGDVTNFMATGDCRGQEYLDIHPEAQDRAARTLEYLQGLGTTALVEVADTVEGIVQAHTL